MERMAAFWHQIPIEVKNLSADFFIFFFILALVYIVSSISREKLKELGFNEYFKIPIDFFKRDDEREKGASDVLSLMISGSLWVLGACWMANVHQSKAMGEMLFNLLGKVWLVTLFAAMAIFVGSMMARGLMGVLKSGFLKEKLDAMGKNSDFRHETFSDSLSKAVGAGVFCFVFLLVFMAFTEIFGLSTTQSAISAVWNLAIRLFSSSVAILIGWMGITFIMDSEASAPADPNAPRTMDHHARLGIVILTTLFAVDLVAATASSIFWFAILLVIGVCLVPLKEQLFDIWAGFSLEFYQVKKVFLEGKSHSIEKVGLLSTNLNDNSGSAKIKANRMVLAAHFQENPPPGNS